MYCRESLAGITCEKLLSGITDGDRDAPAGIAYVTTAGFYGIEDEDLVNDALSHLRIVGLGDSALEVACFLAQKGDGVMVDDNQWY